MRRRGGVRPGERAAGTGTSGGGRPAVLTALLTGLIAALALLTACSNGPGPVPSATAPPRKASAHLPVPVSPAAAWRPDGAGALPADVSAPPPAPCAQVVRPDGWVRLEDAQSGAAGFDLQSEDRAGRVLGYADRRSATCGQTVAVSLSGPRGVVRLEAYRVGAYRGSWARLVWRSGDVPVTPRPMPPLQPRTNLREANWPVSVTVPVGPQWPPGLYLLVARGADGLAGPAIPLVVRDDAAREQVLFAASTLTWQAYNDWGGYSLYRGPSGTASKRYLTRARVVSYRRPLAGSGYQQFRLMDLTVVRQLEQIAAASGLDVAYTTDVDLDQQPSQLLRHAELVLGGHSEYWTRRGYDALAAARNSGVNLAFLGANNLWWHARLDAAPGAVQPDREIVNRVAEGDPTPVSGPTDLTLLWSQWPEHRDAAAMLGQSHAAINVHGGYQLLGAPAWILAGTGLVAGTPDRPGSTLPLAVGNEADGYNALGANPRDLTLVAVGVLRGASGPVTVSAGYYVAPSGAGVFAAGTTDWSCGLFGPCADQQVPEATAAALRGITTNVVTAFSRPRAGFTHPSVPGVCPPPAVLQDRLEPAALGTYGAGSATEESGLGKRVAAGGKGHRDR